MYLEFEDSTEDWAWQAAETDVLALLGETAALGEAVEDAFKRVASAVYGAPHEAAPGAAMVQVPEGPVLAKIVAVLSQRTLASHQYRRIGELQQITGALAQMGKHCREIALVALELHGVTEPPVERAAPDVHNLLGLLIQQTYIVLRGSVQAVRDWHAPTASHVREVAADVDHTLLDLRNAAQRSITLQQNSTLFVQRLVVAGCRMREIAVQAQTIARLVAGAEPQTPLVAPYEN